jgi:predicted AlkP superfamily phosphohydrolase/phosphomutase
MVEEFAERGLHIERMEKQKIFVIGWDSATWDLIRPWVAQGKLPNLAKLVGQGASGPLESAIPPLTPPAWTSFMTGKNPGKHGIFHFLEPQAGSYAMRYSNAGSRRATTIWRLLSNAGYSVGTINVPFTYPPEQLRGFQISGMDTPSEKSAFVHPPELREELERAVGPLRLEVRYLGGMTTKDRYQKTLDEMETLDRQWTKAATYLLEKHPVDVMMLTFMSIDTVQHHFWQYMDPAHFLYNQKDAETFGNAVQSVYERLDQTIGELTSRLPKEAVVFVVSDHGAGPVSDRMLYLNRYLAQLGLLKYRVEKRSALQNLQRSLTRRVYGLVRGSLNSDQKKLVANLFPKIRERFEVAYTAYDNIDWSETKAYCSEVLASPPSIWINRRGVKPSGIVEDSEYEPLIELLTEKLKALKDPRTGESVIPRVYRRDEAFQGPYSGEAPDLVLDWWSGNGFSTLPSFPEDGNKPPLEIRERQPMQMKDHEWGGNHRRDGILVVNGGPTRKGVQISGARLMDMAATLLYLAGQKIPSDMDARVLLDLFEPEFVAKHPVVYDQVQAGDQASGTGSTYSAEDAALVEERLKALGYIE